MTVEEIETLKTPFNPKSNIELWRKAFTEYNKENQELRMSCAPCFVKVLQWHIKKLAL